jgi:hypothetical protein
VRGAAPFAASRFAGTISSSHFKRVFPAAAKSDRIDARQALQLGEHLPQVREALQEVHPPAAKRHAQASDTASTCARRREKPRIGTESASLGSGLASCSPLSQRATGEDDSPFRGARNAEEFAVLGLNVVYDYDFSYVVPTEAYLVQNTKLVVDYIYSLADRVFNALEPE